MAALATPPGMYRRPKPSFWRKSLKPSLEQVYRWTPADLELVSPEEWENFLAGLLGFLAGDPPHGGGNQNSNYDDQYANSSPLGEFFIQEFGWMPSVQALPGYHYYDYLTQGIDPEYLQMAYAAHLSASVFVNSELSMAEIEGLPFQNTRRGERIYRCVE